MNRTIIVLGIGPGDPELMNPRTVSQLESARALYLRTDHHPIREWLKERHIAYTSFDNLYETEEDFSVLYRRMAQRLWEAAAAGPVAYAVPDPLTDQSVDALYAAKPSAGDRVETLPTTGYADVFLAAARAWVPEGGIRLIPAREMEGADCLPGQAALVTEVDSEIAAGELKLRLGEIMEDEDKLILLEADEKVHAKAIPLFELDRQARYSHLTAVLIPARPLPERSRYALADLRHLAAEAADRGRGGWELPAGLEEEALSDLGESDPDRLAETLGMRLAQIISLAEAGTRHGVFTLQELTDEAGRLLKGE